MFVYWVEDGKAFPVYRIECCTDGLVRLVSIMNSDKSEFRDVRTHRGAIRFTHTRDKNIAQFIAGDVVRHNITGEEWVLSCDEEDGEVMPCGWPMCTAKANDCSLVLEATMDERIAMLKSWTENKDSRDFRVTTARRQLQKIQ